MRSLINYQQAALQSASPRPVSPSEKSSPPVTPAEMIPFLNALGLPSSGEGPPRGPRDGWLKVQLKRLKQFLVKLLRVANLRP